LLDPWISPLKLLISMTAPDQRNRVFCSVGEGDSRSPLPRLPGRLRRLPKGSPLLARFSAKPAANAASKGEISQFDFARRQAQPTPMAERLSFCLIDFKSFISPEQRWHRPRCSSPANESAAFNSPSKNACRTSSQSVQAPALLVLDSGGGGWITAMRIASLSENVNWPA
jgi:hypothetical protein